MATPPALLKRDREMYARECDQVVNVLRATPRPNSGGGSSAKTRYVLRDVAARMIPAKSIYSAAEGRQFFVGDARFCLCDPALAPSQLDVKQGDLIEADGVRWKVMGTDAGPVGGGLPDVRREARGWIEARAAEPRGAEARKLRIADLSAIVLAGFGRAWLIQGAGTEMEANVCKNAFGGVVDA